MRQILSYRSYRACCRYLRSSSYSTTPPAVATLSECLSPSLRVKDIAAVAQGPKIRLGQFARSFHREDGKIVDHDDMVSAWVPMRKGAEAKAALKLLHEKVDLPAGVKIVPFTSTAANWCTTPPKPCSTI